MIQEWQVPRVAPIGLDQSPIGDRPGNRIRLALACHGVGDACALALARRSFNSLSAATSVISA